MNINLITHPVTHNKISIYSKEGIKLLKTYIKTYNSVFSYNVYIKAKLIKGMLSRKNC